MRNLPATNRVITNLYQLGDVPGQILTPAQEAFLAGAVDAGLYASKSEALRASIEAARRSMSAPERLDVVVHAYAQGGLSISAAARLADVPYGEMKQALKDAGILRLGAHPQTSRAMAAKASKDIAGAKVSWPE